MWGCGQVVVACRADGAAHGAIRGRALRGRAIRGRTPADGAGASRCCLRGLSNGAGGRSRQRRCAACSGAGCQKRGLAPNPGQGAAAGARQWQAVGQRGRGPHGTGASRADPDVVCAQGGLAPVDVRRRDQGRHRLAEGTVSFGGRGGAGLLLRGGGGSATAAGRPVTGPPLLGMPTGAPRTVPLFF